MLGEGCRTVKFGHFLAINRQSLVKKRKGFKSGLRWWLSCVKQWFSLGEGREAQSLAILGVLRTWSISAVWWVAERLNVAVLWDK